jgi:superfamily II DNA or RNA helicase
VDHHNITDIFTYMKAFSRQLGERILEDYPALQGFQDPLSPRIKQLQRRPFPAQNIAMMGVAKRWQFWRTAAIVAECGTGKTLMSLGAIHVHSEGKPFTALAMVPPHLVEKWAREAFQTIPGIRVFMIDDIRNNADPKVPHGVNEVRLAGKRIVRKGLHTTLTDMRLRHGYASARKRWAARVPGPSLFIVGRERVKLGYFWRHAYRIPQSGPNMGCLVNPDTDLPVVINEERLTCSDLPHTKIAEVIDQRSGHASRSQFAPLWQADLDKIQREAPIDFIGRFMHGFFDYAIADEMHQLAGDTAQGNALGTLAACADRLVGLTGTLMGGYAKDLYNLMWRFESAKMKERGFVWGASGCGAFVSEYGVLETIETTQEEENDCSDAKVTKVVKHKPGASPTLFGEFLMSLCAFVFLEDIADRLPHYEEKLVEVAMDKELKQAYADLEAQIKASIKANFKNRSVVSKMLNSLLVYPDHPFGIGTIWGKRRPKGERHWEKFVIAEPRDLPRDRLYSKERKLIEIVKGELAQGRLCHIFAVYTQKHDVTARIQEVLERAGIRTAVLRSTVPTIQREAWYEKRVAEGVQVIIGHPKLVETGLDLLDFPTLIFYETGYSLHTLRQSSRRSWRIGQNRPVEVIFLCQEATMQTKCLRLMGKKLLVALTLEGKFAGEGLHDIEEDDDMLAALARELVQEDGIGQTADAIWAELKQVYEQMPTGAAPIPEMVEDDVPALMSSGQPIPAFTAPPVQDELSISDSVAGAFVAASLEASIATAPTVFGQTLTRKGRGKRRPVQNPLQPSLFVWN